MSNVLTLFEIYTLPAGKTREAFEEWYPDHYKKVIATKLPQLLDNLEIYVGDDIQPRIVKFLIKQENLDIALGDPAIQKELADAATWGAKVTAVGPFTPPAL